MNQIRIDMFLKFVVEIRANRVKLKISNRYPKVFSGWYGMIRCRVLGLKIDASIVSFTIQITQ